MVACSRLKAYFSVYDYFCCVVFVLVFVSHFSLCCGVLVVVEEGKNKNDMAKMMQKEEKRKNRW